MPLTPVSSKTVTEIDKRVFKLDDKDIICLLVNKGILSARDTNQAKITIRSTYLGDVDQESPIEVTVSIETKGEFPSQ